MGFGVLLGLLGLGFWFIGFRDLGFIVFRVWGLGFRGLKHGVDGFGIKLGSRVLGFDFESVLFI